MSLSTVRVLINDAKYLLNGQYPLEKPVSLQFPVIDICNSACQMCRIWENKKSDDITPDQLRLGLANPLFSEVVGVGVNGGEPTLRKDLPELVSVLFEKLPKLEQISLITNAYKYDQVIEAIRAAGEVIKGHRGRLDVMVSLDGYGDVHDRVRGKPGNFERAQKVIAFLKTTDLVHAIRIGCTVIKENVFGVGDLLEFCQANDLYVKYRLGIPHQRLYTASLSQPYALTEEERYHLVEFLEGLIVHYEKIDLQKFFYRSLIDQLLYGVPRKAGCDWKHRGATITSRGELLYCAVQSKVLGNITTDDSRAVYFGNSAHLDNIIETKCDTCHHDYVGPAQVSRRTMATRMVRDLVGPALSATRTRKLAKSVYRAVKPMLGKPAPTAEEIYAANVARLVGLGASSPGDRPGNAPVLVCGWYGTETLGDKAILAGVVIALRKIVGDTPTHVVALHPYITRMTVRQMPELAGAKVVSVEEGLKQVAGARAVVFGGGPLMAGIEEMAEMEALFATAAHFRVPSVVAGCGVGPLGTPRHDASIKRLLQSATVRIYRDERSRSLAASLGVDVSRDSVAEDPAFSWLATQRHLVRRQQLAHDDTRRGPVLLLGLRNFPHAQYARHMSDSEAASTKTSYEYELLRALDILCERSPELVIRPLPMCTNHFGDDDRFYYRRLFRNSRVAPKIDWSLCGRELSPAQYCEAFDAATAVLSMRFHSLVFALGLGMPAVALDYTLGSGKVNSLATRFGVPHANVTEVTSEFLVDELSRALLSLSRGVVCIPEFEAALARSWTEPSRADCASVETGV